MKKILIIGASILQLPAIIKAKEMGFYVGVVDYDPNAVGVKHADKFFNVSTIDTKGILELAKEFKPLGLMTLATDMPIRSIARVAKELELPGISIESAVMATDKGEMIQAFKEYGVDIPWFFIINNKEELDTVLENISYPCIIKPVDNAGSRGVILVNERLEILDAFDYSKKYSRNGKVIIEEYMEGKEVSVEAMVIGGEVFILAITDKITTGPPHFVEMGHSQPSQLGKDIQQKINNLTFKAIKALQIENSPVHVEIMVTTDGPKMIELGARMGGDNITTHLVPLSTGIDMVKATIQLSVGEVPDLEPKFNKGSSIMYMEVSPGVIVNISGVDEAKQYPEVRDIVFTKNIGQSVSSIQNSTDRVGYVVTQGIDAENAKSVCRLVINSISVKTN